MLQTTILLIIICILGEKEKRLDNRKPLKGFYQR